MIPAGATTLWLILAIAFIILSGIVYLFQKNAAKEKKYKEALNDAKKELDKDSPDFSGYLDALRRMHDNR